ncbi:MAG: putative ABC transporter permease subunit [Candidatus Kryptoniota bacterium]
MADELLKLKFKLIWLEGRRHIYRHFIRSVFSLTTLALFAYLTYLATYFISNYLINDVHVGLFLYHRLMALALFVFFVIVSVANILVAFATLFRNSEVDFLASLPVNAQTIFFVKFLDSFFYSSGLMLALVIASAAGYAEFFKDIYAVIFSIIFGIAPLIFSAACFGVFVLLILLKFSSRVSLRTAAAVVIISYIGSTSAYIMLNNPFKLFNNVMKFYPHLDRYFGMLDPKLDYFAPSFWSANVFYFSTTHNLRGALASALIVSLTSLALFALMMFAAKRYYFDAFWTAQHKLFVKQKIQHNSFPGYSNGLVKKSTVSFLKRDYLLFVREPSQVFHFVLLFGLILIFLFNLIKMKIYLPDPFIMTVAFTLIFAFNTFLILSLSVRFVYPMISLEGKSFWIVRSAPVRIEKLFYIKALVSIVFLSSLSMILGYAAPAPFKNFFNLIPMSLIFSAIGGMVIPLVVLIFGGVYADFNEKSPVRLSSSHGATVSLLVALGVTVILSTVIYIFARGFFINGERPELSLETWFILVISVCITFACALFFDIRSLKQDI